MEANRDELCRLDGLIGDADHGIAMALGFGAARDAVGALEPEAEPTAVLNAAAKAFLNAVGASSGPLYATALMRAGAAVKGKATLDDEDVVAMRAGDGQGIRDRGKAEPGEKTMLDAWAPAAGRRPRRGRGEGLGGMPRRAAEPRRGPARRRPSAMIAAKGRAERLGERAVGHVDPGAASAVIVIEAMRRSLAGGRGRVNGRRRQWLREFVRCTTHAQSIH